MEEKNLEKPTFKEIITLNIQNLTNFPYIEKDFDALTDYGLLCKVVEKMNEVIKNTNLQNDYIVDLYNAFVSLKDYIDNFFDNLDVQDEINNKLDEMAADGSLTELIKNYVDPIYQEFEDEINVMVTEQNNTISSINNKVDSVASGAPIPVSSTSDMTDTDRIYVNTTDGKWYYYDGDSWEIGGTYQATQIANNSVNYNAFTDDLKDILKKSNYYESKNYITYGSYGSYSISNNKIVLGSTSNHTRIRGINIPIKNGDIIKFNNVGNAYKCGYTFTDSDGNVLLHKPMSEYSSSYNNYLVSVTNVKYFNCMIAYDDDSTIDAPKPLFNYISIVSHTIDDTIMDNSVEYTKIKNAVNSKNKLALDFMPYSYGNTNFALIKNTGGNLPQAIIYEVNKNTTYYIKVFDNHDRFRLIGLNEYPTFTDDLNYGENQQAQFLADENLISVDDDSLNEYTFENTDFKYIVLVLCTSNNPTFPRVSITEEEVENYEEFNMSIPNLRYKVPKVLSRSVYFTESTYAETCEMQGCCTDGTYLYFGMHDANDSDNGVLGKINLSNGQLVSEVKNHSYGHVNGMCYYNGKLYISSASDSTNTPSTIYVANTGDLSYETSINLESKLKTPWENFAYGDYRGVGAIGFSDELNKFVCLIRKNTSGKQFRGFAIFDSNFNLEKLIKINPDNIPSTMTTTVGGLDCDDKYIYLTMTKNDVSNYLDVIQIYDYNGNFIKEIILPASPRDFIEGITKIGNVLYTSNASDKICKYLIREEENIPIGNILTSYNFN